MNKLLEPAVRWMNRLKYAYKFAVIGILIILQSAVLMYLLVSELNKNIEFAKQERLGVQYAQALGQVFVEGAEYRRLHYLYIHNDPSLQGRVLAQQNRVDTALERAEALDQGEAASLNVSWKLQTLRQEWLARKQNAASLETEAAQVAFDLDGRWLRSVGDLMQQTGYASNLALDSDSDTSYLVDMVLRKMPNLMERLNAAQTLEIELFGNPLSAERKNQFLQYVGLLRSDLDLVDYNAKQVLRHNEQVRSHLQPVTTALVDAAPIFAWNFEQKTIGQQGLPISQELLNATGTRAVQEAIRTQDETFQMIDELLALRINTYLNYRNGVSVFAGGILLLLGYLFCGFDMSVRKRMYQLNSLMACVAKGDLQVRGRSDANDEMGELTCEINRTLDSLQTMYEEVQQSHTMLEQWNQELEGKIKERTAALQNLLDYAGQGFLSFGGDLQIDKEYSAECTAIFRREVAGENACALLCPEDEAQQVFVAAVFAKILAEGNAVLQETYFSLLPEAISLGERYISVIYKVIEGEKKAEPRKIMLILTDRTTQKAMEEQMQTERDVLAMIVQVVTHAADFFAVVNQYTLFCREGMAELLRGKKEPADVLADLFRVIHTFKGTFGQLRLRQTMGFLHEMEDRLAAIRTQEGADMEKGELEKNLAVFTPERMLSWLQEDLRVLEDKLGQDFFQRENVLVIDNGRLLELEEKMQAALPPEECGVLLAAIRRLRYKPLQELLQSFPEYTCGLAERHGKAVHSFTVNGGTMMVDPARYYDFVKSMGHVFRNAVMHGLETMEERLEKGKDEIGAIACSVREEDGGICITVADDGRGMDPEVIRDLAVEKGLYSVADAQRLGPKEWLQFIFADGFSAAEEVDELAGRGVGLAAVRMELEKLGGTFAVHSVLGEGTEFSFFLPYEKAEEVESLSIRDLAKPLLQAAETLLQEQCGLAVKGIRYLDSAAEGNLQLRKVSSFLNVKGGLAGKILLSADEKIVQAGIKAGLGTAAEEKLENVLSQQAQQLFRQALAAWPKGLAEVTVEPLLSLLAEDASAKYSHSQTSTWVLETSAGSLSLSLIY